METLRVIIIYGLTLGSVYLLIALGFSLICGVLRIFHLGYAYVFVAAVYVTWALMQELNLGLWAAAVIMFIIQIGIAIAAYRGLIRPYLRAEEKMLTGLLLLAAIAEQAALRWYPVHAGVYLPTTISAGTFTILGVMISRQLVFSAAIALILTLLFVLFFVRTRVGLGVRALSQDIFTSNLMGINSDVLYTLIIAVTVIPAIVAMFLLAPVWTVEPQMGTSFFVTAALVTILGGLGNLRGTLMASYVFGFLHAIVAFLIREPRFMHLSGLLLVMLVLVARPQGIARGETIW